MNIKNLEHLIEQLRIYSFVDDLSLILETGLITWILSFVSYASNNLVWADKTSHVIVKYKSWKEPYKIKGRLHRLTHEARTIHVGLKMHSMSRPDSPLFAATDVFLYVCLFFRSASLMLPGLPDPCLWAGLELWPGTYWSESKRQKREQKKAIFTNIHLYNLQDHPVFHDSH